MLWGAYDAAVMTAVIAIRDGWIDQLYVVRDAQGRGLGGALLEIAMRTFDRLQLWTFQRNLRARCFYEARGFKLIEQTDGARNERTSRTPSVSGPVRHPRITEPDISQRPSRPIGGPILVPARSACHPRY